MKPRPEKLTTYVALLRGINVGGRNIIKMSDLRTTFEQLGFCDVRTFIQSGNVVFRSPTKSHGDLEQTIESALAKRHRYVAKIVLRSLAEYEAMLKAFPTGWGSNAEQKHNVLFLRPAIDSAGLIDELAPKPDIEQVRYIPGALLWSADMATASRSAMLKLSGKAHYQEMTIRNLTTTGKLLELMQEVDQT